MERKPSVAVITYHRHDNYGALLQCYALQTVLSGMGAEPIVIDYYCAADESPLSSDALRLRGIPACLFSVIGAVTRLPRHARFQTFRKRLHMTEQVDKTTICRYADSFDLYLTGSDNVWNSSITGMDKNYFLDFVADQNKRNSYAASFGGDNVPAHLHTEYRELLSKMNRILVRESTGVELVKKLSGRSAQMVLDPTLLLTQEQWNALAAEGHRDEKYVLAYQLRPSTAFVRKARELAKKLGCRLIFVPFPLGGLINTKSEPGAGPCEWLSLIKNAEYVITDSFHGCVFSILFQKEFAVIITQLGTRIENITRLLGLEKRVIQPDQPFPEEKIDYKTVEVLLHKQRMQSLAMLRSILEADD